MKNIIVADSKSAEHARIIAEKTGSQLEILDDPEAMLSANCSLIIIYFGSSRLYLESNVAKVLTYSKCPVYIVKTQHTSIKSLLIPVDYKTIVSAKSDLFKRFARVFDADITILKIRETSYEYIVNKLNRSMLQYITRTHIKVSSYSSTNRNLVKYADKHDAVVLQGTPDTRLSSLNYETILDTTSNVLYVKAKRGVTPF